MSDAPHSGTTHSLFGANLIKICIAAKIFTNFLSFYTINSHKTHIPSYENSHGLRIRRVWHPAIPTQQPNYLPTEVSGGEEPPTDCMDVHRLGEPTKLFSHRSHRNHRSFWCKIFSHRLHGCSQIRRQQRNLKICEHLWNLWENLTQSNHLWASVKSVGEYSSPVVSVGSANSVGEPYAA